MDDIDWNTISSIIAIISFFLLVISEVLSWSSCEANSITNLLFKKSKQPCGTISSSTQTTPPPVDPLTPEWENITSQIELIQPEAKPQPQ